MRKTRKYDREFRVNAVKHYESSGKSLREVGANLGVPIPTLSGWVKEESTPSGKTSYNYGISGEVTQVVDKLGNSTEFTYNTQGLLIQTVDAEGSSFSLR